jgi:indole-3-glycerol phosphate synthase
MILDKIIQVKKEEVAYRKRISPLEELQHAIMDIPSPGNFYEAISSPECAIIAEVKRRSPSKGVLREDFDPVRIALLYEECGAAAVSVLTDKEFFGGDDVYLANIKQFVRLPLLRKDFIIDLYQIYETRFFRGDAVLLISGILTDIQLREYTDLARSLGLSVVCEVHSHLELASGLSGSITGTSGHFR